MGFGWNIEIKRAKIFEFLKNVEKFTGQDEEKLIKIWNDNIIYVAITKLGVKLQYTIEMYYRMQYLIYFI